MRLFLAATAFVFLIAGLAIGVVAVRTEGHSIGHVGSGSASTPDRAATAKKDSPASSEWLSEYTLVERSGLKFRSSELAGKVHVANFFFTACPSSCRVQTGVVQKLAQEFGPQGVTFLSITCDPETDTPVKLSLYAKEFQADPKQWLFLTGDLSYLQRVAAEVYSLPLDRGTHSESLIVMDKHGKRRGRFSWKQEAELADMKKMLSELLAEPTEESKANASN